MKYLCIHCSNYCLVQRVLVLSIVAVNVTQATQARFLVAQNFEPS